MGGCCTSRDSSVIQRRNTLGTDDKATAKLSQINSQFRSIENMVAGVIAEGKPWTDKDFPPESKSLFDPRVDNGDASQFTQEWKRISEVYKNP